MPGRAMDVGSLYRLEDTERLESLFVDMAVVMTMIMAMLMLVIVIVIVIVIVTSMRVIAAGLVRRMDGVAHGCVPESACCQVNTL